MMLYVHIPFCAKKCIYCDFLSHVPRKGGEISSYLKALALEMRLRGSSLSPEDEITSVYIGGGTPSFLSARELDFLLHEIKEIFDLSSCREFTVEANPGTLHEEKLAVLARGGVNRLSFGVQSFCREELSLLGRIHTAEEAEEAICRAYDAGISNLSLDLMAALPFQTRDQLLFSLHKAFSLPISHLSLYSLIVEEGTYLSEHLSEYPLPNEEEERELMHLSEDVAEKNGFMGYEISNYAKIGFESAHNLGYWERRSYLGFGVGAASFYKDQKLRTKNCEDVEAYVALLDRAENPQSLEKELFSERTVLAREDEMAEFFFLGLRKRSGVRLKEFEKEFHCGAETVYPDVFQKHFRWKLLSREEDRVYLTKRGRDLANQVFQDFLL